MSKGFKRGRKWRTNNPTYPFFQLIQQFQVASRRTRPDMTTVFHVKPSGAFIEIKSNLRRKKLCRTNWSSNFLGGSFSNRDNVRAPFQLTREKQPQHLTKVFSSRIDPFISTSIAPVLLDWTNEKSWVFPALESTNQFLSQSSVS